MNEITGWLVLSGLVLIGFLIWKLSKRVPEPEPAGGGGGNTQAPSPVSVAHKSPKSVTPQSNERSGMSVVSLLVGAALIAGIAYLLWLGINSATFQDLWRTARTFPERTASVRPPDNGWITPAERFRVESERHKVTAPKDDLGTDPIGVPMGFTAWAQPDPTGGLILVRCWYSVSKPALTDASTEWGSYGSCPGARWINYRTASNVPIDLEVQYWFRFDQ